MSDIVHKTKPSFVIPDEVHAKLPLGLRERLLAIEMQSSCCFEAMDALKTKLTELVHDLEKGPPLSRSSSHVEK